MLDENAFSMRLDGKFNDRFNGYIRYQRDIGDLASPDGTSGRFIVASQEPDNFVAALTQLYGGSIVNETKFGLNRAATTLDTAFSVSGSQLDFVRSAISLSGAIVQSGVNCGANLPPPAAERNRSIRNPIHSSITSRGRKAPIRLSSGAKFAGLRWTSTNSAVSPSPTATFATSCSTRT
jgi:hypothetical protein